MRYEIEELIPIVSKLTDQYTSYESTSITYEKAEQLMGAVLYCIGQVEQPGQAFEVAVKDLSARQAYKLGAACVEQKVKMALELYNQLSQTFCSYGNQCLEEVFQKGLPEFFKWYDPKFEPQNTIIMIDYPLLIDLSSYTGIDRIYRFLTYIELEQHFLNSFLSEDIVDMLSRYHKQYQRLIENLCEMVLFTVIGHILAKKSLSQQEIDKKEYEQLQNMIEQMDEQQVIERVRHEIERFVQRYCQDDRALLAYLDHVVSGIAIRLKVAAANQSLHKIL